MTGPRDDNPIEKTSTSSHDDHISRDTVEDASSEHGSYTRDYEISHPVEHVSELRASAYQQAKFRAENTKAGFEPGDRTDAEKRRAEREFDREVLAVTPRTLSAAGLNLDSDTCPVDDRYVFTFVLQAVRAEPIQEFKKHLNQFEQIREELGIDSWKSDSNRLEQKFDDVEPVRDAINEAATRARYAVYRTGHRFPTAVWESTVASDDTALLTEAEKTEIERGKIPSDDEHTALRNWAEAFLNECVRDVVSFGRDPDQREYPPVAFVGLFAHAALQSRHITEAPKTSAHWAVNPDVVPTRHTIGGTINDLSVRDIKEVGQQMNQAFLEFANQYDVLPGSHKLAFDLTVIPKDADPDEHPWMKGYAEPVRGNMDSTDEDKDARWTFGVAGMIEPDLHFILGTYPQGRDIKSAHSLNRIFRSVQQDTSVTGRVIMDRGLFGAELVRRCRDTVGDKWLLHAKNQHDIGEMIEDADPEEVEFYDLANRDNDYESLKELTPLPNAVIVPIPDEESADTTASHRVFLTDLDKEWFVADSSSSDDDYTGDGAEAPDDDGSDVDQKLVNFTYRKRRRIENSIQQLKYGYKIPFATIASMELKYCTFYFSALFYNLHNLINNSLSPEHGLPLGENEYGYVTSGQVLSAIREVAFEMAADAE